jgi:hypothetical protein
MKIDFVFLLKAIKENRNIFIYREDKRRAASLRFFSRFFQVLPGNKAIIIDLPYVDGFTHKHLDTGDIVTVVFHEAGFRFHFESRILGPADLSASGGSFVPALKIEWPLEILDGNRRSMFRASVDLDECPRVSYFILERAAPGDGEESETGPEDFSEFEGIEALMIDISESGAAVKINREINIQIGDRIKLIFLLEEKEQNETELEGIVRNVRRFPRSDVHICGIQFDEEYVAHYKRVLRDIACHVMASDREKVSFFTVNRIVSSNTYVQKIVDREVSEDVMEMLLQKELPLNETEFLESLVYVLDIDVYKSKAEPMLKAIPASSKEEYIQRIDANHKVAYYILEEAMEQSHFRILAGAINNPYLPAEFLTRIALRGTPRMLRLLLANKIRLITYPDIMDVIEENPRATASIREKVSDLRNLYLKSRDVSEIPEEDVIDFVSQVTAEEWASAEEGMAVETEEAEATVTQKALSILQKINRMAMSERIKLALSGTKAERMVLAKDPNKIVLLALIESPRIMEDEILKMVLNKKTHKEVVQKICENKQWTRKYAIMLALLRNPKIPVVKAPGFILKLRLRDLKKLLMDRTIHPVVRNLANYFYGKKK